MRILFFFGTRPEAIKLAPVIHAFQAHSSLEVQICVTGQHRGMLDQVLNLFQITPDFDLDLMKANQTLPELTARLILRSSEVIEEHRPDLVVVHGDTSTTFACALSAFYQKVPVGHVEAGLRTGNSYAPWPEEFNRCGVDIFAEYLWAPTKQAGNRLRQERPHSDKIFITGNTVIDALRFMVRRLDEADFYREHIGGFFDFIDNSKRLILVTTHRRESFDRGIASTCDAIDTIVRRGDIQVLWPVHPNPNVKKIVEERFGDSDVVRLTEPLDYAKFVGALRRAFLIITDSGGVQEEAPELCKPVLVTRTVTERPEAVEANAAKLVGQDAKMIVRETMRLLDDSEAYASMAYGGSPYGDGRASERILNSVIDSVGKAPNFQS
ncbi:UDP-N-acetylglucosamine 2-epimerase (non-hydrolyzing) [Thalassovita mediterranea]|nr:UDP-N-acetylglucosamine 2-epimerase (non-hydrolyzing) [Thalassovita mediterranea]